MNEVIINEVIINYLMIVIIIYFIVLFLSDQLEPYNATQENKQDEYIVNGWFITVHNVIKTPEEIILGPMINKHYGINDICFQVKYGYPFFGSDTDPIYVPEADKIGFRAMTILLAPYTGTYSFRLATNDGGKLFYQKVDSDITRNEKNVRSRWITLVDDWEPHAETWIQSQNIYFNMNDLVLIRFDWFDYMGYASACIKMVVGHDNKVEEIAIPYENIYCSLLWEYVPLIGTA